MRGSFRSDLELVPGAPAFRLRRRRGPRLFSIGLALAGLAFTAVDLAAHRPIISALQLALSLAFIAVFLRAELDSWRFEGEAAVRRTFSLRRLRFESLRLEARQIQHVAVVEQDRATTLAFIVDKRGEEYALVSGDGARVRQIAEGFTAAMRLAKSAPPGRALH